MSNKTENLTNLNKKLFLSPRITINGTSQQRQQFPTATKPDGSAVLPVAASLAMKDKAFSLPRLSTANRDALTTVCDGMAIYNTTVNLIQFRENGAWSDSSTNVNFLFHSVTLNPSDLTGLSTDPFLLVASTAEDKLLLPIKVTAIFKNINQPYGGVAPIRIVYIKPPSVIETTATDRSFSSITYASDADTVGFVYGHNQAALDLTGVLGASLYAAVAAPIIASGVGSSEGTLRLEILYANQTITI